MPRYEGATSGNAERRRVGRGRGGGRVRRLPAPRHGRGAAGQGGPGLGIIAHRTGQPLDARRGRGAGLVLHFEQQEQCQQQLADAVPRPLLRGQKSGAARVERDGGAAAAARLSRDLRGLPQPLVSPLHLLRVQPRSEGIAFRGESEI